ncbi:MAG: hypothetical protein NC489_20675 [Ruminococcus flavefaciens]|nr:hypothetical protein [Ruminococcus flavefaciens]
MKTGLGKSNDMEEYYQILVKDGYFDTMKDVMLLAIAIGFINGKTMPIIKYGGDTIREHIFKDDMAYLNIIAVLSTRDIKILLDENKEKKYSLLEQYAEAGMNIFVKKVFNGRYTNVDRILEYVNSYNPGVSTGKKDLSELFDEIIEEMSESE